MFTTVHEAVITVHHLHSHPPRVTIHTRSPGRRLPSFRDPQHLVANWSSVLLLLLLLMSSVFLFGWSSSFSAFLPPIFWDGGGERSPRVDSPAHACEERGRVAISELSTSWMVLVAAPYFSLS